MGKKESDTEKATGLSKKKITKSSAKKPAKKIAAKTKKKTIKEVKAKKEAKKPAAKKTKTKRPGKKIEVKAKKIAPKKKIAKAIEKVGKKEPKRIALPKKKVAKVPARTIKTIEEQVGISITKPVEVKKTYPAVTEKRLPAEYGEDRITLMTVDPWKLFAYWEVREDTLLKVRAAITLRVYDVTGIYFDGKNANITFDIPAYERIGESYIGVGPDRDFIVDIGAVSHTRGFITIARSNKVTTPSIKVSQAMGVLPREIYETGPTVGYF